jgi:hypothetical protein
MQSCVEGIEWAGERNLAKEVEIGRDPISMHWAEAVPIYTSLVIPFIYVVSMGPRLLPSTDHSWMHLKLEVKTTST